MKPDSTMAKLLGKWGVAEATQSNEAIEALQAEFDAFRISAEADVSELKTALEDAVSAGKALESDLSAALTKIAAFEAAEVKAAADAAAAKIETRKQKIVSAVGTERADALLSATESLDDTAFEAVISAMAVSVDSETKSKMFTEQGISAEADASAGTESPEMKILKAKYAPKK